MQIKGGIIFVLIMSIMQISLKFFDYHQTRLNQEFAMIDLHNERYSSFVQTLYLMAVGRILFDMVKDYVIDRRNQKIGQKIRGYTLKRILYAPVNLFFDVTPIGKILEIFNGDIHVFEHMDGAMWGMVEISAHFIVVFTSMFQFATVEVLIFLPLFFYAIYHISKPYLHIDN